MNFESLKSKTIMAILISQVLQFFMFLLVKDLPVPVSTATFSPKPFFHQDDYLQNHTLCVELSGMSLSYTMEQYIRKVAEDLRYSMRQGIPEQKISPLDPLRIQKYDFQMQSGNKYKVKGFLRNVLITNLASFNILKVKTNLPKSMDVDVAITLPYMLLRGEYKISGKVLKIIPVSKQGRFSIRPVNLNLKFYVKASIKPGSGAIVINSLEFDLNTSRLDIFFQGLLPGKLNVVANMIVNHFGIDLFHKFKPTLKNALNGLLIKYLNHLVKGARVPEFVADGENSKYVCRNN